MALSLAIALCGCGKNRFERRLADVIKDMHPEGYTVELPSTAGERYDFYLKYYIDGQKADIDEYYAALNKFYEDYIYLPANEVRVISWSNICAGSDSREAKLQKMAEALASVERSKIP